MTTSSLSQFDGNPQQSSLFVGRERELAFLRDSFSEPGAFVVIEGVSGIGKTALARRFIEQNSWLFGGRVVYTYAFTRDSYRAHLLQHLTLPVRRPSLLVVDEAHRLTPERAEELRTLFEQNPLLSILLIGQRNVEFESEKRRDLELKELDETEFKHLLETKLGEISPVQATDLFSLLSGNPSATAMAADAVSAGLLTLQQLSSGFQSFEAGGIVGPDGQAPQTSIVGPSPQLVVQVAGVNDELLRILQADPEILRKVSPRKFEEIVAELLSRQGYKVELTPATRDGGFDMYAAKADGLGQFLYLVECKQYTPPSKVGVQVIRSLYGTVQQTKATAGIIATTSFFTNSAEQFQSEIKHQISLRDFLEIKKWLGLIK